MFSNIRNITLAVAAVAALGTATLMTSTGSADARGFGGGGFSRGGGGHVAVRTAGFKGGNNLQRVRVGVRVIGHGPGRKLPPAVRIGQGGPHHHLNWCRFTHRCGTFVRWHRPWIYGVGAVAAASYAVAPTVAAAAPAPTCTCLTKQYTPDNLVVFQDVCTKEVASAPIGNTQVQIEQPQGPVQQ
jgi:hypothetical protein